MPPLSAQSAGAQQLGDFDLTLRAKTVLVIGGSSGIGHEIARQARAEGAVLTITGRDPQRLARAAEALEGPEAIQLDAHDETALAHFFTGLDPVDHMVSMVGDSMAGGFLATTPETMRHVLHSKLWTRWMIGRHAPKALAAGGSVIFTSGTGGRAQDGSATVANLGLGALVEGLAYEMAPDRESTRSPRPSWERAPGSGRTCPPMSWTSSRPGSANGCRSKDSAPSPRSLPPTSIS